MQVPLQKNKKTDTFNPIIIQLYSNQIPFLHGLNSIIPIPSQ